MKRAFLPAVLLALLAASSAPAAVPAAIWYQTNFDNPLEYTVGNRLAHNVGWGETVYQTPTVWEPGTTSAFPARNVDVHIIDTGPYCSASNSVVMQGYRPASSTATLLNPTATCASTQSNPPNNVNWDAYSAGNLQILNLKMTKLEPTNQMADPPLHAGIYLMDNDPDGNNLAEPIVGWVFSTNAAKPQLLLPTYMAPNWTTNRYFSPEGTLYAWTDPYNTCREFTAVYDPSDGSAKFYYNQAGTDILLWEGNAGAGRVSKSVYVRDFIFTPGGGAVDVVCLDDLAVGTTAKPVVTAPVDGVFLATATPTIQWDKAFPAQTRTSYQVKVCTTDDPAAAGVYTSAVLTDSAVTHVPTSALPINQQLFAFVTETYAGPTGWSLPRGDDGFYCVTSAPTAVTVTSPSGLHVGAKPSVIFSGGVLHNQFEVKVTTDPAGSTIVWESGVVDSLLNGASCEVMLTPGVQYYAFAKAMNPVGPTAWSASSAFQVTRTGEGTDIRTMEETWGGSQSIIDHSAAAPDDGFNDCIAPDRTWAYLKTQVLPDPLGRYPDKNGVIPNEPCDWWPAGESGDCPGESLAYCDGLYLTSTSDPTGPNPPRAAPSHVLDFWNKINSYGAVDMRRHRVANLDLDKGVTFMTYARGKTYEGAGGGGWELSSRSVAQRSNIYICDDYGTGKCMASFRYGQSSAGICTDNATWALGSYTDTQIPERPGQGWHIVRITGRNRVIGDPSTCEWKMYVAGADGLDGDGTTESTTPLVTSTGAMESRVPDLGTPIVDSIAVGFATGGIIGNWQYDWTAVNTDGNYAPGEWMPYGAEYATVSEAVAQGRGQMVSITGDAVITAIKLETGSQVGFWVQDVATTDYSNIYIASTVTTNVERGHKVTGLSGALQWSNATGASLTIPGFTVTTTDTNWPPVTMQQKALVAGGYPTENPEGTHTVGKFAQIAGRITDVLYLTDGSLAVYLDDGCGLVDGRSADGGNPTAKGVRVIVPEPWSFFGAVDDYYEARGVCASETAEGRTVRTLLGASFTEVAVAP